MSDETSRDEVRLKMLGVEDSAPEVDDTTRDQVRGEILARRRRYLELQRTSTRRNRHGSNWRLPLLLLGVLTAGVATGGFVLQRATAEQEKTNLRYAVQLLDSAERYYCEDLTLLNQAASDAEALLPSASILGIANDEWQMLYSASVAARSLFNARLGHSELAVELLDTCQGSTQYFDVAQMPVDSQILFSMCLGKAGQSLLELQADLRDGRDYSKVQADTIAALERAYDLLEESNELTQDEAHLLAAGLQLDLARGYLRAFAFQGHNPDAPEKAAAAALRTKEHLNDVSIRSAEWWVLQLQLDAHEMMLAARSTAPIDEADWTDLVENVQGAIAAANDATDTAPQYAAAINFQSGILLSNLADLLFRSASARTSVEMCSQVIELRTTAIDRLGAIPANQRTHRHHTNLYLNYARRMLCYIQLSDLAEDAGASASFLELAKADAIALQAGLGSLLVGPLPQLGVGVRTIAAQLLDETDSPLYLQIRESIEYELHLKLHAILDAVMPE
ncbi:MAG TPA: hypothetical protein DDW52_29680 [Planctomycetaceae bacterium]|nr:hypothetical protein [Planctomycetaceae bacterium]